MLTYESFTPGETVTYGAALMTREAIVEFARRYDPQPFHLDAAAAKTSLLGGLAASGWHTACTLMRLSCDGFLNQSSSWGGPGVKQLKWLQSRASRRCADRAPDPAGQARLKLAPGNGAAGLAFRPAQPARRSGDDAGQH